MVGLEGAFQRWPLFPLRLLAKFVGGHFHKGLNFLGRCSHRVGSKQLGLKAIPDGAEINLGIPLIRILFYTG